MNEETFYDVARRVLSDRRPLDCQIDVADAWTLVSALQLATRHPGISGEMRDAIEYVARQFQNAIVDEHPDAGPVLEMGWNPALDR